MQEYRAFIMGPDGHVQNRVDLRCNDESEAVGLARQFVVGHDVELWQLDRHIETFKHTSERPMLRESRPPHMKKITLAVVAGVLTTVPLVTPAKAQGIKMAQVDMQTGRHFEDRDDRDYRDRRRYDSGTTVGVGPGGVTIGPRQRCRTVTTQVERDDGRRITRRERVCD